MPSIVSFLHFCLFLRVQLRWGVNTGFGEVSAASRGRGRIGWTEEEREPKVKSKQPTHYQEHDTHKSSLRKSYSVYHTATLSALSAVTVFVCVTKSLSLVPSPLLLLMTGRLSQECHAQKPADSFALYNKVSELIRDYEYVTGLKRLCVSP